MILPFSLQKHSYFCSNSQKSVKLAMEFVSCEFKLSGKEVSNKQYE